MTSTKETAFIYCRVSTEKQDTERQLRELTQFAKDNNLNVVKVYEETLSGTKSLVGRRLLLDAVAEHKPKYFIIHDYSRFSRNVKTALMMKDEIHDLGICIWSMQTNMRSLDDNGTPNAIANMVFTQLLSVYEMENETKRQHIKSGLANAVANGVTLGRPVGSKEDKLAKYPRIVKTIIEQEKLRSLGSAYLSVRKTATFVKRPASLIISLRKEMKMQGLLQEVETLNDKPRQFKDSNQNIITMDIV